MSSSSLTDRVCCFTTILVATIIIASTKVHAQVGSDIVDINTLLPAGYNNQMRPSPQLGTTEVKVEMIVDNLISSDEIEQSITLDIWLATRWHDDRIVGSNLTGDVIVTDDNLIGHFWSPELYFINGLDVSVVDAFRPIRRLAVASGGAMLLEQRLNARLSCYMNLQNFPHDLQYCPIILSTSKCDRWNSCPRKCCR